MYRLVVVRLGDRQKPIVRMAKINAAPSKVLPCFDGSNAQTSQEKTYLVLTSLAYEQVLYLGESRRVTREWHAQGDARAEAASPLARALSRKLCAYLFT